MWWEIAQAMQQTAPAAPAVTDNGANLILSQITVSAVIVWGLQALKAAKWATWVTNETEKLNTVVAVIASGLASAGVHWTGSWHEGWVVTIPSGVALLVGLWHWLQSYAVQQTIFRATVYKAPDVGGGK